jgi:hypothetical protein
MMGDNVVGATSVVAQGIGFDAEPIEEAVVRGLTSSIVGSADADTGGETDANEYIFRGGAALIWTSAWTHGCQLERAAWCKESIRAAATADYKSLQDAEGPKSGE